MSQSQENRLSMSAEFAIERNWCGVVGGRCTLNGIVDDWYLLGLKEKEFALFFYESALRTNK